MVQPSSAILIYFYIASFLSYWVQASSVILLLYKIKYSPPKQQSVPRVAIKIIHVITKSFDTIKGGNT
jgi:hypothetical protein